MKVIDQRDEPLATLRHRPQFLVKYYAVELLRLLFERDLVGPASRPCVGQARGEDPAVAFDDRLAAVARVDVRGAHERWRERSILASAGEIFLIGTHGELDDLVRDLQEFLRETAEKRHRPFGKTRIFSEKAVILDQGQAGAARRSARAPSAMILRRSAGSMKHMAGAQFFGIIAGAADRDAAGMMETMPDPSRPRS